MPYIKAEDRVKFEKLITEAYSAPISTAGELNYLLTNLYLAYIKQNGEKYQTYNDIIGCIECSKLELYRRSISSYESVKIAANGDVAGMPYPIL